MKFLALTGLFLLALLLPSHPPCLGAQVNGAVAELDGSNDICRAIMMDFMTSLLNSCSEFINENAGVKNCDAHTASNINSDISSVVPSSIGETRQSQLNSISNIRAYNRALLDNRCFLNESKSRGSKITLVSSSTDNIANYAAYAYMINSIYAIANSYYFKIFSGDEFIDYEPIDRRWHRVWLLYEMMSNGTLCDNDTEDVDISCYFVWVDSDLIFLNSIVSIHSLIEVNKSADIIISSEYHAETGIANTGCFIIKKSQWSLDFLHDWWYNFDHSAAHDQVFFDRLYKFLLPESSKRIVVLPITALNSKPPVELTLEDSDNVLHLMGVDNKLRESVLAVGMSNICKFANESLIQSSYHADSILDKYRRGEGLPKQLGLTRLELQRIYSNKYDEILLLSTVQLAARLMTDAQSEDSLIRESCHNVFDIDIYIPTVDEGRMSTCLCSDITCMSEVLDNLSLIREVLLHNRMLMQHKQSETSESGLAFTQRYYGDVEFLVKMSTSFAGRILYRLGGRSGSNTKYKETRALKTLLLQVLHFAAVTSNDFIDSYHQFNNFNAKVSFFNYSRFSNIISFKGKKEKIEDSNSNSGKTSSSSQIHGETNVFTTNFSSSISLQGMYGLLEFYLDILLQMVSLDQLHLIEEMVLSFHSSVGTYYANQSLNIEKSRIHFKKAHETSLNLIRTGRGNLYRLLQPYILWGRAMHEHRLYQESLDALLELFCIIDRNELVLLDQMEQQQLSEEHLILAELYYLNSNNVKEILNGKSEVLINPAVLEICSAASHGVNRAQDDDNEEDPNSSRLPSVEMSGFYVQESYWKFKLQHLCNMIGKQNSPQQDKYSSYCLAWNNESTTENFNSDKSTVKKIHRKRKKK